MKQSTLFISPDISQQNFLEKGSDALIYILAEALHLMDWVGLLQITYIKVEFLSHRGCDFSFYYVLLNCFPVMTVLTHSSIASETSHFIHILKHSFLIFITSLLRYKLYTIQGTCLNYTNQWFLLHLQSYAMITTVHFRTFSSPSPKTPIPFSYHPTPTPTLTCPNP